MNDQPTIESSRHGNAGLNHSIHAAVVGGFYSELVQAGRYAKERAGNLFYASAVLSTALIAALAVGGVSGANILVRITAIAAVLLWVVSGILFAWAASPPDDGEYPTVDSGRPEELVSYVITESTRIRQTVEGRVKLALKVAAGAMVASLFALAGYMLDAEILGSPWVRVVALEVDESRVPSECANGDEPSLSVERSTLNSPMVAIRLDCEERSIRWLLNHDEIEYMGVVGS